MRGGTKWPSTMEKVKGNNRIPAQQQNFWRFFQKHLDKWLRPLGISEGALSGINFDAIWLQIGAANLNKRSDGSKVAPFRSREPDKRENDSESEPKIKNFREKRIKIGFSCSTP